METVPVVHSTFVIERRYPAPVERVFAAFADPALRRKWYADGGRHELVAFESDLRPGGESRLRYKLGPETPFPGIEIAADERFHDVVDNRRIVSAQVMSLGGRNITSALLTIELTPSDGGTLMTCTHQGAFFENSGGPEMREQGWNDLFDRLGESLA
jgi:uncharacterized protein YndB with AHSA1/START domain